MEHGQFQVDVTIVTNTLCQRLSTHVTVGIFLTRPLTRYRQREGGGGGGGGGGDRGRREGEGGREGGRHHSWMGEGGLGDAGNIWG